MRKKIPFGSVFQRNYRDKQMDLRKSGTWFEHYYANEKPVRIAIDTENRDETISILHEKLAKASRFGVITSDTELRNASPALFIARGISSEKIALKGIAVLLLERSVVA